MNVMTSDNALLNNTVPLLPVPLLFGVTSLFGYNFLENLTFNFNLSSAVINYTAPSPWINFMLIKLSNGS